MSYSAYFFKEHEKNGAKDDILFLNLYTFRNRRKEPYVGKEKDYVLSLKGNYINDLPIIGSFCRSRCKLDDVRYFLDHIDYRFIFEKEAIKFNEGRPVKVISFLIIEVRYYYKKGMAIVLANGEEEERSVLSIIYTIEDYIKLKLSSGLEFSYVSPKYKELTMNKEQMENINEFLKYKLRASELDGNEDKYRSIRLDGFSARIQENSSLLKSFSPKTKVKILEFYYKDFQGKKQKVSLSENGKILSTVFLEVEAFEEIVRFIYLVQNCTGVKEFLTPIEYTINEYCNYIHEDMLEEARGRKRILICDDLKDMVQCCSVVYLNTVMNVLLRLCQKKIKAEDINDTEENQYLYLTEFLQLFLKKKHNLNLKDSEISTYYTLLSKWISKTDSDECRLIEALSTYNG